MILPNIKGGRWHATYKTGVGIYLVSMKIWTCTAIIRQKSARGTFRSKVFFGFLQKRIFVRKDVIADNLALSFVMKPLTKGLSFQPTKMTLGFILLQKKGGSSCLCFILLNRKSLDGQICQKHHLLITHSYFVLTSLYVPCNNQQLFRITESSEHIHALYHSSQKGENGVMHLRSSY